MRYFRTSYTPTVTLYVRVDEQGTSSLCVNINDESGNMHVDAYQVISLKPDTHPSFWHLAAMANEGKGPKLEEIVIEIGEQEFLKAIGVL